MPAAARFRLARALKSHSRALRNSRLGGFLPCRLTGNTTAMADVSVWALVTAMAIWRRYVAADNEAVVFPVKYMPTDRISCGREFPSRAKRLRKPRRPLEPAPFRFQHEFNETSNCTSISTHRPHSPFPKTETIHSGSIVRTRPAMLPVPNKPRSPGVLRRPCRASVSYMRWVAKSFGKARSLNNASRTGLLRR